MVGTTSDDFLEKTFRIMKHDGDDCKFFTKLVSKETSTSAASFRMYYGDVSSSIPFTWETIPGTPKHKSFKNNDNIPPLTPPPSHYTSSLKNESCKETSSRRLSSKPQLLHTLLRRINPKKVHVATVSASSPCWSPSYDEKKANRRRRMFSSWGSSFDERMAMKMIHRGDETSRASNMRFGTKQGVEVKIHRYSSAVSMLRKALLTIVGRGSD